jgi:hypothetical protein
MLYLVKNVKLLLIILLSSCVSKKKMQPAQTSDNNSSSISNDFILNRSVVDNNIEYVDPLIICLYIFIGVIIINLILFILNKR